MEFLPSSASTRMLRMPELRDRLGISRSSIYLKLDPRSRYYDSQFPVPIKLGLASVGWRDCDVQGWLDLQAARAHHSKQANSEH